MKTDFRAPAFTNADLYGMQNRRVLSAVTRSDGYVFFLTRKGANEPIIFAGCRTYTMTQFRKHCRRYWGRAARGKRKETLAILDLFKLQLKATWSR